MAVNAMLGTAVTTSSTIMGRTGLSAVMGQTLSGGSTQIASDSFPYANGTVLDTTGNWIAVTNDYIADTSPGITIARGQSTGNQNCVAWNGAGAGSFTANQYSEITVYKSGNGNVGVIVRGAPGGTCYRAMWGAGTVYLDKGNSGTYANVTSVGSITLNDNNKIRLSVTGTGSATRLVIAIDSGSGFVDVLGPTDPGGTYINSGVPGLGTFDDTNNNGARSWRGGNL